jgi:5-methylcytosine-specific restriction endonuclease McrA
MREIDKTTVAQPKTTAHHHRTFFRRVQKVIDQKSLASKSRSFTGYDEAETRDVLRVLYAGGYTLGPNGEKEYGPKCAYCESTVETVAALQVEHYRPKKEVTGEPTHQHQGYYWLAYEWTNLLYACPRCNGAGAKANLFPVGGPRVGAEPRDQAGQLEFAKFVASSSTLQGEQPLLLHPEVDRDLDRHLAFNAQGGIFGLTDRGRATIQACQLDRRPLQKARKQVLDGLVQDFKLLMVAATSRRAVSNLRLRQALKAIFDQIFQYRTLDTYTLFRAYIARNFEDFIVSQLPLDQQPHLRDAYQKYRNNEL